MKKLVAIACLALLTTGAFAQGLVNFGNVSSSLVSVDGVVTASGAAGSYFFGLFTAASGTTDPKAFAFSGVYATNTAAAGRFNGGVGVSVPNWAPGVTKSFYVAGWNSGLGHDYQPAWADPLYNGPAGFFGISGIGTGAAGGFDGTGNLPNLALFTAGTIAAGWNLSPIPVPEPTTMALAGLGAAALLIFRRRK